MISRIIKILKGNHLISNWLIHETLELSEEVFFIKKAVDINRSKNVRHYMLTIFVDFEESEQKYTGVASTNIHPSMSEKEIQKMVDETAFAASFVKNKAFPMVGPQKGLKIQSSDNLTSNGMMEDALTICNELYKQDQYEKGWINSAEIFVNKFYHRIINSKGVDVSYVSNTREVEVITQWKENNEDVELYDMFYFTDDASFIEDCIKEQLMKTKDKTYAKPMLSLKNIPIIISGDSIKDIFNYYVKQASAQLVYEGISQAKVDTSIQGDVKGDALNIKLVPLMENSIHSAPVDEDGKILDELQLYTEGVLNTYHGSNQYSSYLGIETTGDIKNYEVGEGSRSYSDMIKSPHIELLAFSSFNMSIVSGDFGGEIRLARYFDGEKSIPLSGGTLAANLKKVHHNMFFTKEITQINNYKGPKALIYEGDIVGAE